MVNDMKRFFKRVVITIGLIIIALGSFLAGGIAYKNNQYQKIPGATHLLNLFEQTHFYPAPLQDNLPILEAKELTYPYSFIVYGDSRGIAFAEKTALISNVITEKPSFVIHLGDMVDYGDPHQWKNFDSSDGNIIKSGILLFPVLGNHEYRSQKKHYLRNPEKQLHYYFDRFKFLKNKRWYSFTFGNSVFLILDTNTDYSPGSEQHRWLMDMLKKNASRFLFVAFHHPPYTKVYDNRNAEKSLAQIFEKGPVKPDIIFSGHQHNYERYRYNGINYIVSGGGGAAPYSVRRAPEDFYNQPGDTFHYCKITVSETKALFEMIKLDKNTGSWQVADSFAISKPAP